MATLKTSPKSVSLTAPQVLALASAAGRDDGALTLPARLKGRAAQNFVDALIEKGLVREVRAKPNMPVCRRDADTGRSYALVVTKLGRSSIPVSQDGIAKSAAEPATNAVLEPGPLDVALPAAAASRQRAGTNVAGEGAPSAGTNSAGASNAPRSGSKLAEVITLLVRQSGASTEELMASTGWLPHTTRAALTGLRKRGFVVLREHAEGKGSVYRIEPVSSAKAA